MWCPKASLQTVEFACICPVRDDHRIAQQVLREGYEEAGSEWIPGVADYTTPDDPDWGYVEIEGVSLVACGRCGVALAKVGTHMDWHRWLDEKLGAIPSGTTTFSMPERVPAHESSGPVWVKVGQLYAGVSGNTMEVTAIDGDRCEMTYNPNPTNDDPWWDESYDVARNLTLVRDV